jgi:hypothetical protein
MFTLTSLPLLRLAHEHRSLVCFHDPERERMEDAQEAHRPEA